MNQQKHQETSYQEARKQAFVNASTIRIFGVPLQGAVDDDHTAIWWCGLASDGLEYRQRTNRIWHLPKADIVASGEIQDFEFDGHQICFYDLDRDSEPVEETFTPVSLSHTLRLYLNSGLGNALGISSTDIMTEDVPVTISPKPTKSPSGPPVTITP